jgi:hypothetical protein
MRSMIYVLVWLALSMISSFLFVFMIHEAYIEFSRSRLISVVMLGWVLIISLFMLICNIIFFGDK